MTSSDEFRFKAIRDSIYGYVGVSKTELGIIDTEAFRRLHRIKQLSNSDLVYPTATHTRLEHSLGAMHMAGRMCDHLGVDEDLKRLARMAALLHDIGHGPFSHTFEEIMEKVNPGITDTHERIGRMIIENDDEIKELLGDTRHTVSKILGGSKEDDEHSIISDIVSSNLDADKLDYFARDSYNLGVKYGVIDTERILHVLRTDSHGRHVGIHPKGIPVIHSYRLARYMIATQVYTHPVRLAADQMLFHAACAAFNEGALDKGKFEIRPTSSFLDFYKSLDDASFLHTITHSDKSDVSREILDNIRKRKLLKTCYQGAAASITENAKDRQILDPDTVLRSAATEIRKSLELHSHELIMHESDLQIKLFERADIKIFDEQGVQHDEEPLSPLQAASSAISYYVFGLESKREEIKKRLAEKGIFTRPTV